MDNQEAYDLEPKYSNNEISGKCLKCLSEQEMNSCLMQMLRDEETNEDIQQKYQALIDFLESPEFHPLRVQSENLLAEGKKVSVKISFTDGKPKYELRIKE
jgi:hypothetical protein